MPGRPWERDRLNLEMGSQQRCDNGIQRVYSNPPPFDPRGFDSRRFDPRQFNPRPFDPRPFYYPPPNVGRKYKNDLTPISFVSGEQHLHKDHKEDAVNETTNNVVKTEPTEVGTSATDEPPNTALNDLNWVNNSQKSQVLLQMMSSMGYEHGKGLGKRGQGIVEPIKPNPNSGKNALGYEYGKGLGKTRQDIVEPINPNPSPVKNALGYGKRQGIVEPNPSPVKNALGYEHGKGLGKTWQGIAEPINPNPSPVENALGASQGNRNTDMRKNTWWGRRHGRRDSVGVNDGAAGSKQQRDGGQRRPNPSLKTQMHYGDIVKDSLRAANFPEQSTEEIWQAIGVLAKHQIMPLGMAVGLVKRRIGKKRVEIKEENE